MRKTKIVATLGPATDRQEAIEALIRAGVDVFRCNFSHGSHDYHRQTIKAIRAASAACGQEVAILQDLCGPKIRVGEMADGVELVAGREVTVTTREVTGTAECFTSHYAALARDVQPGEAILLDDGNLELKVLSVADPEVRCEVVRGGRLKSRKGMNLPGTRLSTPSLTEKDRADLAVGLEAGVDFVALSFVRRAADVAELKALLDQAESSVRIIAKIEKPEAIEGLEEIVEATDGIMVARGDLGVELDAAEVPFLQKAMIRQANRRDRYVITATQMLESMVHNGVPTRAETSDVATAVLDGTDAVMLSAETAVGEYPEAAVQTMAKIARRAEEYLLDHDRQWNWNQIDPRTARYDALANAVLQLSRDLKAKAIVAYTASGGTALYISKSRPFTPIVAFTDSLNAARRMKLYWGVLPVYAPELDDGADFIDYAERYLREQNLAGSGDSLIAVRGASGGAPGANDAIEVRVLT